MSDRRHQLLYRTSQALFADANALPDAELVRRLARDGDRAAFELLLWRHGPMVWGVCKRTLAVEQDAEDAFQNTFIALARRSTGIGDGAAVAGWLYRVALRAALAVRKDAARRSQREHPTANLPELAAADNPERAAQAREVGPVIDEEIARLPEKYRLAFLLCEVQGRCRRAAAAELNCPIGTVESRLSRARERLRAGLTRRGFAPPAVFVACAVSAALRAATLRNVIRHGDPSLPLAATGMRAALALSSKKVAAAAVVFVAATGVLLASLLAGAAPEAPKTPDAPAAKASEPAPAPAAEPELPREAIARIGSARLRHTGMVACVAFSPDGRLIASVDEDGKAVVWDAATGEARHRVQANAGYASQLAFAEGGRALWVAPGSWTADNNLVRLDLATGKQTPLTLGGNPRQLMGRAFDPAGQVFGYAPEPKQYRLVDTATNSEFFKTELSEDVSERPVIAAGGKVIAFPPAHGLGTVRLYDTAGGKRLPDIDDKGHSVRFTAISHDGTTLLTLLTDAANRHKESLALWEVKTGKLIRRIEGLVLAVGAVGFSPDDRLIAVGSLQRTWVQLFDVATGREVRRIRSAPGIKHLAFSPDGKTLAAGRSLGTVSLWDVATGKRRPASADPEDGGYHIRFLPGGGLLDVSDTVTVRDARTGAVTRRLLDPRSVDFSGFAVTPDLKLTAESDLDGTVRVMDGTTGEVLKRLKGHTALSDPIAFTPDGRLLVSRGYDETLRIWDVAQGKGLHKFDVRGRESGRRLAVSPDGRLLATTEGVQGRYVIRVWEAATGKELHKLPSATRHLNALAFSPDGTLLACAEGYWRKGPAGALILWDMATGQQRWALAGHDGGVLRVSVSPDGRTVASGGADGSVRLWECATGKERHAFRGHEGAVFAVAFSPDGRRLASSSPEAPTFVWDVYRLERTTAEVRLTDDERTKLWDALGGGDAGDAFAAVRRLCAAGAAAVDSIRKRLRPQAIPDDRQIQEWISQLDSDRFAVRQKATADLSKFAPDIEPALRRALEKATSAEVQERLKLILAKAGAPTPERLRELRALEVIERIGSPAAVELLDELARGPAAARLTHEATAARKRLAKQ